MSEAAITVEGVSKNFRIYRRKETTLKETILRGRRGEWEELCAADNLSFTVPHGQALGVIGPNGAGKSTLLKMLARILTPDNGRIAIDGRVSALLELGAGFHPEYSAVENIFLSGAFYGMSRSQLKPRVDSIIEFAELARFADNPVKTYSSGMYARLGFAIAVSVEPDVLLCDEVLAVGDESFRQRCYDRMLEFRDAGRTRRARDARPRGGASVLRSRDLAAARCDPARRRPPRGRARVPPRGQCRRRGDLRALERRARRSRRHAHAAQLRRPDRPACSPRDGGRRRRAFDLRERRDGAHRGRLPRAQPRALADLRGRGAPSRRHARRHRLDVRRGLRDRRRARGPWALRLAARGSAADARHVLPLATLRDHSGVHVLDRHERWVRVQVREGRYLEREGCVVLPGSWALDRDG